MNISHTINPSFPSSNEVLLDAGMKEKILVVDDEDCVRFAYKDILQAKGYEVATAGEYNEALTMLEASDFDLIYTDIRLGGKTGIDILSEVKRRNLSIPVVIMTGCPSTETASESVRLGAFDYISKPIEMNALLHITKMALQQKSLADEKEKYRLNLEAIFNSVRDAITTVDKNMSILEMNDAASDLCNISREDMGKSICSLPGYCSRECLAALKEAMSGKRPVELYHIECKHRLRPKQVVSVTAYPLLYSGSVPSGAILVVSDETPPADFELDARERLEFHNIVGKSKQMQGIYTLIENLAKVQTTVLITGESGTGKELVVKALHYAGNCSNRPLIKVNCSALSETLLESELFGHVKGAFTGAVSDRVGRFQMAEGGTIFLDEIGDITPKMQLQLLRVLQEKEIDRVGDSTPIRVDVRIVAATNQDLVRKVKRGEFRQDLYYRFKVVELNLPPLRKRKEDIPLLTNHFLNEFNKKFSKEVIGISADVQEIFMNYPWPGNVRELKHAIEHAFIHCQQKVITVDHLPGNLKEFTNIQPFPLKYMKADEREAILHALKKTAWRRTKAARLLGMSRSTFYRKIEEYKINLQDMQI